jgi:hypothetical protein
LPRRASTTRREHAILERLNPSFGIADQRWPFRQARGTSIALDVSDVAHRCIGPRYGVCGCPVHVDDCTCSSRNWLAHHQCTTCSCWRLVRSGGSEACCRHADRQARTCREHEADQCRKCDWRSEQWHSDCGGGDGACSESADLRCHHNVVGRRSSSVCVADRVQGWNVHQRRRGRAGELLRSALTFHQCQHVPCDRRARLLHARLNRRRRRDAGSRRAAGRRWCCRPRRNARRRWRCWP